MKIRAFTILEMIIVLLITSILVGGVYYSLNKNTQLIFDVINKEYSNIDLMDFKMVFQKDMSKSTMLNLEDFQVTMGFIDNMKIVYVFSESHIVRTTYSGKDTFNIVNKGIELYYSSNDFDVYRITISEDTLSMFFLKEYDPATQINKIIFADGYTIESNR